MRVISSKVHGVMDYIVGLLLIAAPWIFGFAAGGAETWVPVIIGVAALIYSVMTRYELGLVKVIPLKVHLGLDVASGIILALSPWLFGFSELVYWPHLIFGLLEIGAGLMTQPYPEYDTVGRTPGTATARTAADDNTTTADRATTGTTTGATTGTATDGTATGTAADSTATDTTAPGTPADYTTPNATNEDPNLK